MSEPPSRPRQRVRRLARGAGRLFGPVALLALAGISAAGSRTRESAVESARSLAERWRSRPAARRSQVGARARHPLRNLWDVHPEARRAFAHDLGLRSVPIEQIAGTAVAGPAQRGGDFLPLPAFRSANWRSRWQRVLNAVDSLTVLPPVDLVKFGDEYWVEDGHNRVAAALYNGQLDVDAVVRELRMPGAKQTEPTSATVGSLAPILTAGSDLRAAGMGRLTPGSPTRTGLDVMSELETEAAPPRAPATPETTPATPDGRSAAAVDATPGGAERDAGG